jgi:hypothetical protein
MVRQQNHAPRAEEGRGRADPHGGRRGGPLCAPGPAPTPPTGTRGLNHSARFRICLRHGKSSRGRGGALHADMAQGPSRKQSAVVGSTDKVQMKATGERKMAGERDDSGAQHPALSRR